MKYKAVTKYSVMVIFKIFGIRTFSDTEKQCDTAADQFFLFLLTTRGDSMSVVPNGRSELTTNSEYQG